MDKVYRVIGLMSGTSLDGLDIAYCIFTQKNNQWAFEIEHAVTIEYNQTWRGLLSEADTLCGNDFWRLHVQFGHYIGKQVKAFVDRYNLKIDLICSSGHTVFHRPELGYTAQIGDGSSIAAETGIDTVCDFRSMDVAYSGQGAPLVPIGDKLLFSDYGYCLNIGGICNVSFDHQGYRIAWDVAPANMLLNYYASTIHLLFDENGAIAESGVVNVELLDGLNAIDYYHTPYPKSLGKEYVFDHYIPLIDRFDLSINDKLATICEHIAVEVARAVYSKTQTKVLVTGGGALNSFLVKRLQSHVLHQIFIPENIIIQFKEALIFAFLGVLRVTGVSNSLKEVTGASRDSVGGAIYRGGF